VRDADAGVISEPGDAAALAAAVGRLAAMPVGMRAQLGDNGRRYLATNLEKRHVIDFYEKALMDLAHTPHSPAVAAGQRT
jgi:glycosyltransferase involved in cell wall biosynthesis